MKRFSLIVFWVLTATVLSFAQTTGYFPQIADGVQSGGITWRTTIYVTNPAPSGTSPAAVTITFTASTGAPFQIAFVDSAGTPAGTGSLSFTISGAQTQKFVSTGAGALSIGFGTLNATATVVGNAVFSEFGPGGGLISEASVSASGTSTSQAIFVDTQSGFDTGVAYANPNGGPVSVGLELLNTQGVLVVPSTQQTLAGNQQTAAFVKGGLFPSSPALAGSMRITSSVPVAVVALRFSAGGQFTTLPPVNLGDLLAPVAHWLEQRPWMNPLTSLARLLGGLQFRIG
jgi:hypothetical protein